MEKQFLTIVFVCFVVFSYAQKIYTVAGNGAAYFTGDGVQATSTGIIPCGAVALDTSGNMYVADTYNNRIRKVDASSGIITTVAGTGIGGYNGDGIPATSAQIYYAMVLALDASGNIYIGDYSNNRIRKVDVVTGIITTIAGTGEYGYNGDDILATSAMIKIVTGIAVDQSGNVYFSDPGNARIRKIDVSTGLIHCIAGTGTSGYNGDNIQANLAQLYNPWGIALDASNNIFIADKDNNRIRKVETITGKITTVAGSGIYDIYNGDGIPATTANFRTPNSVAVDVSNNIFISDEWNGMIFKVNHSDGLIYSIAGTLTGGFTGEGILAVTAKIDNPTGISLDQCGNAYISEYGTKKIRKIFSYDLNPVISNVSCNELCDGSIEVEASGGVTPYTYIWSSGLGSGTSYFNLCANSYSLTVSDAVGCKERLQVNITEPYANVVSFQITNATCHANGSASVDVSGGPYPLTYLWSNGSTLSNTSGLSSGTYFITITDANNCTMVKSFNIINNPTSFQSTPICMVTVDTLSQHNIIVWDKTTFNNTDTFYVYREIATNNYQPIASVPYEALSQFVDTVSSLYFPNTGNPNVGTYRYKLKTRDSCGTYSVMSQFHNTIYMLNNGSGIFYWVQPYTIENSINPVSSYVLMRDDYSNGNWHAVSSVAGTQQTVSDPLYVIYQNTASWRVKTVWNVTCVPTYKNITADYSSSFSNIYSNEIITGIKGNLFENSLNMFPNPTDGIITINSFSKKIQSVEIFDIIGKDVYSVQYISKRNNIQTNISDLPSGIYFIKVKTDNGILQRKLVKK